MGAVSGVETVIGIGGKYLVAQTSAELSFTDNTVDLNKKEAGYWGEKMGGEGEWSASTDVVYEDTNQGSVLGANGIVSVDVTHGGTTETVRGLQEVSGEFGSEFNESADIEDPLWRFLSVVGQSFSLDLSGTYRDPASTDGAAIDLLLTAQDAGDAVDVEITFAELSFSGTMRPGDWTLALSERGDNATFEIQMVHDGPVSWTEPTSLPTPISALMSAYFNRNTVSARFYRSDGTAADTAKTNTTEWNGSGYIETLTFEASRAEDLGYSIDIAGDGPLNRSEVTA